MIDRTFGLAVGIGGACTTSSKTSTNTETRGQTGTRTDAGHQHKTARGHRRHDQYTAARRASRRRRATPTADYNCTPHGHGGLEVSVWIQRPSGMRRGWTKDRYVSTFTRSGKVTSRRVATKHGGR